LNILRKGYRIFSNLSPCPLPLQGKGGVIEKRGGKAPSLKTLPPLLFKERGIKGIG
jgi:hypothetical protein